MPLERNILQWEQDVQKPLRVVIYSPQSWHSRWRQHFIPSKPWLTAVYWRPIVSDCSPLLSTTVGSLGYWPSTLPLQSFCMVPSPDRWPHHGRSFSTDFSLRSLSLLYSMHWRVQGHSLGVMVSGERRPITGIWGQRPLAASRAEPLVRGSGDSPHEAARFLLLHHLRNWPISPKICFCKTKKIVECLGALPLAWPP